MMKKSEAHKIIAAMPPEEALRLLEIGVRGLKPEVLNPKILKLTLEEFILAILAACIEEADKTLEEADAYLEISDAGMN